MPRSASPMAAPPAALDTATAAPARATRKAKVPNAAKAPPAAARPASRKRAAPKGAAAAAPAAKKASKKKAAAPVRVKLVRDSFTMPEADFELIGKLKQRALKQGREVKKSELLRAGLHVLAATNDAAFGAAVAAVPKLKTGRPHAKKDK